MRSKIILFLLCLLWVSVPNGYPENITKCIAVSSDSESIYKLDLVNYKWVLDSRWKRAKYFIPCISPSGRYLAFAEYRRFFIIDSDSNKIANINRSGNDLFSWSPDEEYLAFLGVSPIKSKDDKVGGLYLYNLKTKELKIIYPLASSFDYPSTPSWNNKGDKVYFISKDNMVIEFDLSTNTSQEITGGKGVDWVSETELLIRKERKYYLYNLKSKKEKYLFKLGWWQYPPISLSPDKKVFLCWDTMPRRFGNPEQWYTAIREFPSGKTIKVISNYGANCFSWYCVP